MPPSEAPDLIHAGYDEVRRHVRRLTVTAALLGLSTVGLTAANIMLLQQGAPEIHVIALEPGRELPLTVTPWEEWQPHELDWRDYAEEWIGLARAQPGSQLNNIWEPQARRLVNRTAQDTWEELEEWIDLSRKSLGAHRSREVQIIESAVLGEPGINSAYVRVYWRERTRAHGATPKEWQYHTAYITLGKIPPRHSRELTVDNRRRIFVLSYFWFDHGRRPLVEPEAQPIGAENGTASPIEEIR